MANEIIDLSTEGSPSPRDPVSHRAIDPRRAHGKSFYRHTMYYFESRVNKTTFDEDPELWIPTPHASLTSSSIAPDQL